MQEITIIEEAFEVMDQLNKDQNNANIQRLLKIVEEDGRKLVTIRRIDAIDDIPGADLIKVATIEGWKVVVKAGEFQVNDLCVYLEVDSFVQKTDERFAFLMKNQITWEGVEGARLRTIRLRKQISQGLALPVKLFPEIAEEIKLAESNYDEARQLNLTVKLGVMKWDKPVSAQLAGMAKGNFPSFLRKSDQERCQNMAQQIFGYEPTEVPFDIEGIPTEALLSMFNKGELVHTNNGYAKLRPAQANVDEVYEVTIKLDGSSMTVYRYKAPVNHYTDDDTPVQLGVCSRNLDLKIEGNEDNSFVKQAQTGIFEMLEKLGKNIALQGELCGPGIQGNPEGFAYNRFFVYNVFDIDRQEFLSPLERTELMADLEIMHQVSGLPKIEEVPVVTYGTLASLGIHNMDDLLKFAEGKSLYAAVREGLVFKSTTTSKQFKAISNKWLEGEK
jgi:hypothetical protein